MLLFTIKVAALAFIALGLLSILMGVLKPFRPLVSKIERRGFNFIRWAADVLAVGVFTSALCDALKSHAFAGYTIFRQFVVVMLIAWVVYAMYNVVLAFALPTKIGRLLRRTLTVAPNTDRGSRITSPDRVLVYIGAMLFLMLTASACSREQIVAPVGPAPDEVRLVDPAVPIVPMFALETDGFGSVPVLAAAIDPSGVKHLRVMTAETGERLITIGKSVRADGFITERYVIGTNTDQIVSVERRGHDPGARLDVILKSGSERVDLSVKNMGGLSFFFGRLTQDGQVIKTVRVDSAMDPATVDARLTEFYPTGPLSDGADFRLLWAVVTSSDWENHLALDEPGIQGTAGNVDQTTRNWNRMCVTARWVAALSGKFLVGSGGTNPIAATIFIPALGFVVACEMAHFIEVWSNDDETGDVANGNGTGGGGCAPGEPCWE